MSHSHLAPWELELEICPVPGAGPTLDWVRGPGTESNCLGAQENKRMVVRWHEGNSSREEGSRGRGMPQGSGFMSCLSLLLQSWLLEQHRFIILWFWKSEVQNGFDWAKIKCWQGWISLPSLVPRGPTVLGSGPSSLFKGSRPSLLADLSGSLRLTLPAPSFTYKAP